MGVWVVRAGYAVQETGRRDGGQGHKRKACKAGWRLSRCSVRIEAEEN